MLETIIRGRSSTTTSSSALIAFEPRQVTLAKQQQQKMKNKKMSSEILEEIDSQGKTLVEKSTHKLKKKKKRSKDSSPLLHSIATYLENKGFAKTVSAFKSESSIEELDGLKEHTLDLEEMYNKYVETSNYDAKTNNNGSEKLDLQKEEGAEEDKGSKFDSAKESIIKVKRKERNGNDADIVHEQPGVSNGFAKEKKKKSKLVPDSSGENTREVCSEASQDPADNMVCETQLDEPDKKPKDKNKKKKKNKRTSESLTENVEHSVPEALPKVSIEKASAEEKNFKSKDKKRKKSKSTSEDDAEEPEKEDLEKPDSSKEEKGLKKRKRLSSEENESQPDEKIVTKESQQINNKGSEEKRGDQVPKTNSLQESDGHAGKKRKTEHGQEEAGQQANGSLSNNGKQGSTRKQPNGSAEPKTMNAFKRVDVEKVEFVDERLQDNSYWAKDGADSGYGAKAQEVLGQVRGRDFRHEKTKKKRGSYRGGPIDLQSHSIKFNYSDEE